MSYQRGPMHPDATYKRGPMMPTDKQIANHDADPDAHHRREAEKSRNWGLKKAPCPICGSADYTGFRLEK